MGNSLTSVFLYKVAVNSYHLLAWLIAPINKKARLFTRGRKNIFRKISQSAAFSGKTVWVHCSSLGEFEQGRPVIETLKSKYPEIKIFLTFFSPSGYEIRKYYEFADFISYLPRDNKKNAKKLIYLINPELAVFVKYDFWYFYFKELKFNNIPLFVISAVFHENNRYFGFSKSIYKEIFSCVTRFFVQDKESMDVLEKNMFHNASLAFDTRIDRVYQIAGTALKNSFPEIEKFRGDSPLLVAGSCYEPELKFIKSQLNKYLEGWKIILAPHHTNEADIVKIEKLFDRQTTRYSELKDNFYSDSRILVINKIGILAFLYQFGDIAFIGGGFGKGVHNTLEPACFGIPIICGPKNHTKFREIVDMLNTGGLFIIRNQADFEHTLVNLKSHTSRQDTGKINREYIISHTGGTKIVINELVKFIL